MPLFDDILTEVRSGIQGLDLEGVDDANVNVRKSVDVLDLNRPNVQVTTPRPEIMRHDDGTNAQDDVVYPVLVTLVDADNQNQHLHFGTYLNWRERIAAHFRHQPLSGVSGVSTCHVEPLDIVDEKTWLSEKKLWVSGLLLLFSAREDRG